MIINLVVMCGINGFIKVTDNSKKHLDSMNKSIIHRGPDGQGIFVENKNGKQVGLGQVRLSIIDLSDAGFQPMYYSKETGCFSEKYNSEYIERCGDNALKIVFNGEIYNYQDLKSELVEKGYKFTSKTDTEVILASYLEWGKDCVNKFNGMWSFVIYDSVKSELFCSRDRLGKKPFYYYFDGEQFIFSSEIKGILENKELKINRKENIDSEAIDFYFTTGYIPAPWTIYKNVKKLEARHSMVISIDGFGSLNLKDECYYKIPKYKPINDKKLLVEEGKKLLEETVKDRMFTSDVPVGANLSGGLDSSSVVAEMTKWVDKEKLHTFSIGFEGKYDESKYIHIVEKAFGTNHHHEYFEEENFEKMLSDIYYYYDEPFGDYSNFPTTFVSQLAKKHVTVVLTGDGGDEIFGGYMMHQVGAQMSIIWKIPRFLRKIFYYIIPRTKNNLSIPSKLKESFRVSLLPKAEFMGNIGGSSLYKPKVYVDWAKEKMSELLKVDNGNFTQAMIDFDLFYNTLADNFLVKTDRASMSQSLEYRSPFCDVRWIEWGRKCPVKRKTNRYDRKILMKKIIKDIVPDQIINRGKQGFEPPLKKWVLQEKYLEYMKKGLKVLFKNGILNKEWNNFYTNNVFKENNTVFNVYKIKLFLLIQWYDRWIEKIS